MGIMETLFGSKSAAPAAPAPQAPASQAGTEAPSAGAAQGGEEQKSALDVFKESFKLPESNAKPVDSRIFGDVDPKKVMESAGQVNFLQVADPKDIELVKAGGEEATKAMARILQAATSATYGQSAIASTQLIEQAAAKLEEKLMSKLPSQVRNTLVDTSLATANSAFNHPAVAPLVQIAKDNFIRANPTASPEQITSMTTEYMKAVAEAFGEKPAQSAADSKEEIDWYKELGLPD